MNDFGMKLRIWLRAEATLLKAEAQRRVNRAILMALSGACVVVALAFLNVGAFFALTEAEVDSRAAFSLAAANLVVALVPVLIARLLSPGVEEGV